jgi:hypothetical protein
MRKKIFRLFFFLFGFKNNRTSDDKLGTIIILLDGLSFEAINIAIQKGYCPTVKKLLKHEYSLSQYYCGLPAATTATEALLFYGNRYNIPGFTWYDRDLQAFVRGNRSKELAQFEDNFKKRRNLFEEGSVIMSVYSGGATELSVSGRNLSFSRSKILLQTAHYLLMALLYPVQLMRTVYLTLKTVFLYRKSRRQSTEETLAQIVLGQFSCFLTEIEIMRNTKRIFVDFLLYDEYAHEYGPLHPTSLSTLRLIDRYIKRIMRTAYDSERKYELVILSDHGQTESIPYDKTNDQSILDIKSALSDDSYSVIKTFGGFIPQPNTCKELYVVPAGSTLQLYFSHHLKAGCTESELENEFPGFIKKILASNAFGWVLVRCSATTSALYGKNGSVILSNGAPSITHSNPFPLMDAEEIKSTIHSFEYYSTFTNNGDLVLFGDVPVKDKVYAFEKNHGNHGGFYGAMVKPFILTNRQNLIGKSMADIFDTIAVTI